MPRMNLEKDASILTLLDRLRADLGSAFDVVDHWGADRCAIGVERDGSPKGLVYVSTFARPSGRYDLELEDALAFDADGEPLVPQAVQVQDVDYAVALQRIKEHLDV